MKRLILVSLVLATSIPPLYAQGTILHTDRSGYTTGIDGNPTVNTYMHYIRHEQSLWHSLLKMPDHRSLRPRDRDRQRLARGRLELNNIGPVGLRAPIVRDYSRASQSFLFAHLTRAKHD